MMKKNNHVLIAAISAVGVASVATAASVVSKILKKNLLNDLNESEFGNTSKYGCCTTNCCGQDDSYDEVLRHRKNRCYQRSRF